jgi:hypothetical protein
VSPIETTLGAKNDWEEEAAILNAGA